MEYVWAVLTVIGVALQTAPDSRQAALQVQLRPAVCRLGPLRSHWRVMAGDALHFRADISGLTTDARNFRRCSLTLDILDPSQKLVFHDQLDNLRFPPALPSRTVAHYLTLPIRLDQKPGRYTLQLSVMDLIARRDALVQQVFEIAPPDLALVRLEYSSDLAALVPVAPVACVGQKLFLNGYVTGFAVDQKTEAPALSVACELTDEKGERIGPQQEQEITEPLGGQRVARIQFELQVTVAGRYRAVVTVTDKITGKKATASLPLIAWDWP